MGFLDFVKSAMQAAEQYNNARASVEVRTYSSDREFERDAQSRMATGWRIEGQVAQKGHVSLGRTLLKGNLTLGLGYLSGFSRTKDKITVTWVR